MMTNAADATDHALHASWLHRSMPTRAQIREFLHSGAIIAWSDDRWIIAWGAPEKRDRPATDRPSFYVPDFFLSDPAPWRVYPHAVAVSPDSLANYLVAKESPRVWQKFDEAAFTASLVL